MLYFANHLQNHRLEEEEQADGASGRRPARAAAARRRPRGAVHRCVRGEHGAERPQRRGEGGRWSRAAAARLAAGGAGRSWGGGRDAAELEVVAREDGTGVEEGGVGAAGDGEQEPGRRSWGGGARQRPEVEQVGIERVGRMEASGACREREEEAAGEEEERRRKEKEREKKKREGCV